MTNSGWQNDPIPHPHVCQHPSDGYTINGNYPEESIWVCPVCKDKWKWQGSQYFDYLEGYYPSWENLSRVERQEKAEEELRAYKRQFPWWKRPFIQGISKR